MAKGATGVLGDFPLTLRKSELEINLVLQAARRYLWKQGGTMQNDVFGMRKEIGPKPGDPKVNI
jgi:hypothetical protein